MLSAKQNIDLLARTQRTFNLKRLIERLAGPNKSVLDAGCGSGILSIWAAQAGARVLAIDNGDMAMPEAIAQANCCLDSITYKQADLNEIEVPADDLERFDLLLALVYMNDPRRDENQIRLAHRLSRDFVKSGGDMIPDRILYTARPVSWPDQNLPSRQAKIERQVEDLEHLYGMKLEPLLAARLDCPEKDDFPDRAPDGCVRVGGARELGVPTTVFDHSYRSPELNEMPDGIDFEIAHDGVLDALVWSQKLFFGDHLIFQNESISWVSNPAMISAGKTCRVELGRQWRLSNKARIVTTA